MGLGPFIAANPGSIRGQGTKDPESTSCATWPKKKKTERERRKKKVTEGHTKCAKPRKTTLHMVCVPSPTGVASSQCMTTEMQRPGELFLSGCPKTAVGWAE